MGLVQNLKKKLNALGDKILVELSCLYIRQLAKQTTKRQDNSSPTTSLQSPLTTESRSTTIATSSAGTSEKITMMETEDIVSHVREWAIGRIESYDHEGIERIYDQLAIVDEFVEWLDPKDSDLEIVSLDEISEDEYDSFVDGIERS